MSSLQAIFHVQQQKTLSFVLHCSLDMHNRTACVLFSSTLHKSDVIKLVLLSEDFSKPDYTNLPNVQDIQHAAVMFLLSLQQVHISVLSCNARPLWRLYLLCAAVSTFPNRLYELRPYYGL